MADLLRHRLLPRLMTMNRMMMTMMMMKHSVEHEYLVPPTEFLTPTDSTLAMSDRHQPKHQPPLAGQVFSPSKWEGEQDWGPQQLHVHVLVV